MKTAHHSSRSFRSQPSALSLLFLLLAALPAAQAADKSFVPTGNSADPSGAGNFSGATSWVNTLNNPATPPTAADDAYFNRFATQIESTVNFTADAISDGAFINKSVIFNLSGHTYSLLDGIEVRNNADLLVNGGAIETRVIDLFPSNASMTVAEDATVTVTYTGDEVLSASLSGNAELAIHGSLIAQGGTIGVGVDSGTAQLTISGMSASVRSAGYFDLGTNSINATSLAGAGKVEVRDGGSLTVSDATGGAPLRVGVFESSDTSTLTVATGGTVVADLFAVARAPGAKGAVTVSGQGSSLRQIAETSGFRVGRDGTGTLLVEAGAEVSANASVEIGFSPGSEGAVTVTGSGSTLTTTQTVAVGGGVDEAGGAGALTVADGGLVSAGGKVLVRGGGQVALNDGAIEAAGGFDFRSGAEISGSGVLEGNVVSQGTLYAPGHSPGRIEITGNWTLASTDTLLMELASSAPGEYDAFLVGGAIDLGGAALSLSLLPGFAASPGEVFVLIDHAGADALTGQFAGIAEGQSVLVDSHLFVASYLGGTGNDFTFTAVPEPSACALLSLGGAVVLILRRRGRAWPHR